MASIMILETNIRVPSIANKTISLMCVCRFWALFCVDNFVMLAVLDGGRVNGVQKKRAV